MYFGTTLDIFKQLLDIVVVAFIIYKFLQFSKGTRTIQIIVLLIAILALYLVSQERLLDLPTFRWLLDKFWSVIFLVFIILFQDDIRRSLSRFKWMETVLRERTTGASRTLEEVVRAARSLSAKRLGALIAIERSGNLEAFIAETGVRVDGYVSKELLFALFLPVHENPTHDGAVVLSKDRIIKAACILPLTSRMDLEPWVGTRHRAALGLSERVDAVVVVVSEESGRISVAVGGELNAGLSPDELRQALLAQWSEGSQTSVFDKLRDLARRRRERREAK